MTDILTAIEKHARYNGLSFNTTKCAAINYNTINKATFADFFPRDAEAAFANLTIQSGAASTLAFFVFPFLSKVPMAIITYTAGIVAIISLFGAFGVHARDRRYARLDQQ